MSFHGSLHNVMSTAHHVNLPTKDWPQICFDETRAITSAYVGTVGAGLC